MLSRSWYFVVCVDCRFGKFSTPVVGLRSIGLVFVVGVGGTFAAWRSCVKFRLRASFRRELADLCFETSESFEKDRRNVMVSSATRCTSGYCQWS